MGQEVEEEAQRKRLVLLVLQVAQVMALVEQEHQVSLLAC
jgi:hypothetical protein